MLNTHRRHNSNSYALIHRQTLFDRLVLDKGAFFCFGHNTLFREILRSIGFRCYSTGARTNRNHATSDPEGIVKHQARLRDLC